MVHNKKIYCEFQSKGGMLGGDLASKGFHFNYGTGRGNVPNEMVLSPYETSNGYEIRVRDWANANKTFSNTDLAVIQNWLITNRNKAIDLAQGMIDVNGQGVQRWVDEGKLLIDIFTQDPIQFTILHDPTIR